MTGIVIGVLMIQIIAIAWCATLDVFDWWQS